MLSTMKRRWGIALIITMLLSLPTAGMAASTFMDVSASVYPAQANDIHTSYAFSGYDVVGSSTYAWASGSLKVLDNTSGTVVSDWGTPVGYSGWNSFVRSDGADGAYVGFTVSGNTDDRIYRVDSSGTWSHVATMAGNYDMELYGGNAYVSGLNSTNWSDPNSIWLLDQSGSNNHDLIVQMSGNSAGLAFDGSGNAYYASYDNLLYRWDASAIAGASGASHLTYADGTKLADLELGAYDITVDAAGNIIFNGNGAYAYNAMWNGIAGDGYNYDYIGIANGPYGDWLSFLDAEGDVTAVGGGALYQADFYYMGIAEINAVPVPTAVWLLGSGLLGLVGIRRRKAA